MLVNALAATLLFHRKLSKITNEEKTPRIEVPLSVVLVHLVFLIGVVAFANHPVVFIGLLLFFIGFAHAYERYQDRLICVKDCWLRFF